MVPKSTKSLKGKGNPKKRSQAVTASVQQLSIQENLPVTEGEPSLLHAPVPVVTETKETPAAVPVKENVASAVDVTALGDSEVAAEKTLAVEEETAAPEEVTKSTPAVSEFSDKADTSLTPDLELFNDESKESEDLDATQSVGEHDSSADKTPAAADTMEVVGSVVQNPPPVNSALGIASRTRMKRPFAGLKDGMHSSSPGHKKVKNTDSSVFIPEIDQNVSLAELNRILADDTMLSRNMTKRNIAACKRVDFDWFTEHQLHFAEMFEKLTWRSLCDIDTVMPREWNFMVHLKRGIPVNLGSVIFSHMASCVQDENMGLPFAHVITALLQLCGEQVVPVNQMDTWTTQVIGANSVASTGYQYVDGVFIKKPTKREIAASVRGKATAETDKQRRAKREREATLSKDESPSSSIVQKFLVEELNFTRHSILERMDAFAERLGRLEKMIQTLLDTVED
ncbi:hypothetical protein MLD38_004924 [Melastoma candidum]|uniref:Uncharacterized protein n=2 Tax=Melastoma candidum TaxID=119954 RepID=A0ACB9S8J7_9MYRT|nr:hypothetical protein MLD38_004923 [Melastoma candidum]KAI4387063.1 hypothetical protein MLD38_004924 [Melastoma candidum]